jgi:hypothetical protein
LKVVYIAGPYRSKNNKICEVIQNIRNAEKIALKYWKLGYAVICPHKNTSLFDGYCDDKIWLEGDLEILKRCDIIVMMSNYFKSSGAIAELNFAEENNIEVIFDNEEF